MKNKKTLQICIDASFLAIIIILTFVPYLGFISIPGTPISFTIIHVVVLLGAMLFGFKEGLLFGFIFGLCSLIKAATMPQAITDPLFVNPLISILPRMIFGGLSGLFFSLVKKTNKPLLTYVLFYVLCGLMTLFHSFLTLSVLYLFNMNSPYFSDGYLILISSVISINGIIEIVLAIVVTPNIALSLFKGFPQLTNSPFLGVSFMQKKLNYKVMLKPYKEEAILNLRDFIAINSTYDEKTIDENNPFGKGVSDALNYISQLAKNDGFHVTNYGNKIVEILYGEGEKNITIMAHADVVPATGNWSNDPFDMIIKNDILYGRGVSDDKGPLMCCYYALKAIKNYNLAKGYQIRFLVGGNEESGSLGMKYYFETLKKNQPTYGFSPDADWPIIFAEKAIMNFNVTYFKALKDVISISGGVVSNAVIDKVVLKIKNENLFNFLRQNEVVDESIFKDNVYQIIHYGKSAHGSTPELGKNAVLELLSVLAKYYQDDDLTNFYNAISPLDGKGLNIDKVSKEMGHNSLNLGLFNYENNKMELTFNFRFVDGCDVNLLKENIRLKLKDCLINFDEPSKLLYYPKKSKLIKTLLKSYQKITKDKKSKPIAIGGGTYAKEADNVVAFGMQFKDFDTHMHESDECIRLDDFNKSMEIYLDAILSLGKLIKK